MITLNTVSNFNYKTKVNVSVPTLYLLDIWVLQRIHMGDFTQPQQKYAGTGENCNIAITAFFILETKIYENSCTSNLGV